MNLFSSIINYFNYKCKFNIDNLYNDKITIINSINIKIHNVKSFNMII